MPASRNSRPIIPRCLERDFFEGQPFRVDGAFFHPVVLWLCGWSLPAAPHKPKSRSGFCPLRLFLYTIRTHPAGCRRNWRSGVSLLHRCLFACYTFQFVYLCAYYPFCISFIGYFPLFGNQTDLFSQKNPAFLPYKRLPPQHFHLPALTSAQLHATPLSVYCRFRPAF